VEALIALIIIGIISLDYSLYCVRDQLRETHEMLESALKAPRYNDFADRVIDQLRDIEKAIENSN
jgi:hypothetical protein